MASVLAGLINYALGTLMEIDETYHEKLPDGRLKVVFVTSGIKPETAQVKTALWAILGIPVQAVDSVEIEELQTGPIIKRYKVTVILKPLIKGIEEGNLGLIDTILGKNVRVIR